MQRAQAHRHLRTCHRSILATCVIVKFFHYCSRDLIMANVKALDSTGATIELKATGAGSTGDPSIPVHNVDALTTITNVVHVDDNSGSLTVDGTVAATQGGTWTVQPGNTANTTAWKVDGSAVTQPVSAASLPLPSNASTLTEQQSQTTALQLIDDTVATAGSAITTKGQVVVGTDGTNARILKLDSSGEAQVDVLTLPATEVHLGEVGGNMQVVSVELTRPADTTAYAANDVVADSTSAATLMAFANLVRVNAGGGYIVRASLVTDKKSITPRLRIHLFNASNPTIANDNVAHKELYADVGKRLGYFDLPAMVTAADTTNSTSSRAEDGTLRQWIQAAASTRTIYVLLETLDAFTPASGQKITLKLHVDCY